MSNSQKISAMSNAATPLTGAELVPIVQNGLNVKVATGLIGAINNLQYQGTWNASTNSPTITSSVGTTGYYYIVSTAGSTSINGVSSWQVGDWIIFSNTGVWQRISGGTVSSLQIVTDTSSNTNYNVALTNATSGLINTEYVDPTDLSFNPSTKTLTATNVKVNNTLTATNANITNITTGGSVITGGSIDGTPIGATTPSTGRFSAIYGTNLTPTRVVFVGSGGQLVDSSYFTFDSSAGSITTYGDAFFNGMRVGHGAANITSNSVVGQDSLSVASGGTNNTAMGYQSLKSVTTGSNLTAFGYQAGYSATTAAEFNVFGYQAGYSNTDGHGLTAVGYQAGYSNVSGWYNSYLGSHSGNRLVGQYNTAVGGRSLFNQTSGDYNTFVGADIAFYKTSGNNNAAIGYGALTNNVTGSGNVAIGMYAGAWETGSNTFYVNNRNLSDTATEKAGSLMWGTFDTTPANQTLTINAKVTVPTLVTTPVAFASLPSASGNAGARAFINNSNTATFGAAANGSGSTVVPVWSNGTSWLVG